MKYASLCVLAYNRPDFLIRSLSSLERNTTFPHERIINDDSSPNIAVSSLLIDKYKNNRLTYLILNSGKNQGIGKALRNCIGVSTGEYIFKLDSDLEYLPNWLEIIVGILEKNPDVGVAGLFNYRHYDPKDNRFNILEEREDCFIVDDFVASAFGFKREVFDKFGNTLGDDGWQQDVKGKPNIDLPADKEGFFPRYKIAIPKKDVVLNFGFGTNSVFVQDGKPIEFHKQSNIFFGT